MAYNFDTTSPFPYDSSSPVPSYSDTTSFYPYYSDTTSPGPSYDTTSPFPYYDTSSPGPSSYSLYSTPAKKILRNKRLKIKIINFLNFSHKKLHKNKY